jgi:hypothetical protein
MSGIAGATGVAPLQFTLNGATGPSGVPLFYYGLWSSPESISEDTFSFQYLDMITGPTVYSVTLNALATLPAPVSVFGFAPTQYRLTAKVPFLSG